MNSGNSSSTNLLLLPLQMVKIIKLRVVCDLYYLIFSKLLSIILNIQHNESSSFFNCIKKDITQTAADLT